MRLRTGALLCAAAVIAVALPVTISAHAAPPPVVVSDNPADFTPDVLDGQVNAIVRAGGRVLVGGTFTKVQPAGGGEVQARTGLFAYDAATGALDPAFAPQLNGTVEALALDASGAAVFVGGSFSSVDGVAARKLAKLSVVTGAIVPGFATGANAVVQDLAARGDRLYVSGKFSTIGGVARSGLARLNPATGAVDAGLNLPVGGPAAGTIGVPEIDLSPDGATLIALGNFSTVAGQPRSQLALLDVGGATAAVKPWYTDRYPTKVPDNPALSWCQANFPTYVRDVAFSPDGRWFVVVTAGGNRPGRLCDAAARFETVSASLPAAPTWSSVTGGDSLTAVTITDAAVYVGGHQQFMNNPFVPQACGVCPGPAPGGVARSGIAALDPLNGLPYQWNPGRERGLGVSAFEVTAGGLLVGSDTERLGGEHHGRLGEFPLDGGVAVPPSAPHPLPGDVYTVDTATGALSRRAYDLATMAQATAVPGVSGLAEARGAFAVDGTLYTGGSDGTLSARPFDGTTAGAPRALDLHGLDTAPDAIFTIPGTEEPLPSLADQLRGATGMFFDHGRLYYTVTGDERLYYRWFTPQSGVVGAELFVAATGPEWATVRGMTMASGTLLYATADGGLWRAPFDAAPTGTPTRIGGPDVDGTDWSSRAMFVF